MASGFEPARLSNHSTPLPKFLCGILFLAGVAYGTFAKLAPCRLVDWAHFLHVYRGAAVPIGLRLILGYRRSVSGCMAFVTPFATPATRGVWPDGTDRPGCDGSAYRDISAITPTAGWAHG